MGRIIGTIGLLLCLVGVWQGVVTWHFTQRAITVEATVDAVEELRGPPKPRQKIPLHISFRLPGGSEHRAVAQMPMLQVIAAGDRIRVLVDPQNPQRVVLPLLSEIWARSLTYLVCGALILALERALRSRDMR